MQLAFLIAKALLEGDFASYFARIPSAVEDPESVVLRQGRFERVSRMEHEERGTVTMAVLVVCEVEAEAEAEAEADANACERWIRSYGWEPVAENGAW
mgnify:CR=1 FL=1